MSFLTWAPTQWMNFAVFLIATFALGSWWQGFVEPKTAMFISGMLVYAANILIYMQTGKPGDPTKPEG